MVKTEITKDDMEKVIICRDYPENLEFKLPEKCGKCGCDLVIYPGHPLVSGPKQYCSICIKEVLDGNPNTRWVPKRL